MAITTISTVRETSLESKLNDSIIVTNTGGIKSSATAIFGGAAAFSILGSVVSEQGGIDVKGAYESGFNLASFLSVAASGSIVGHTFGARIGNNYDIIYNEVENAGLITGERNEALFLGGQNVTFFNQGFVHSYTSTALIVEARGATINNVGTIIGGQTNGKIAVQLLNDGYLTVNNDGHIYGDVLGGTLDDTYDGRAGFIQGVIRLGLGNNTVLGGDRSEVFVVGGGENTFDGGGGNDTVLFEDSPTGVQVDLRILDIQDTKYGFISLRHVETVGGSKHNDTLVGSESGDSFLGGTGDDNINGFSGDDTLDGGADIDTALFSGAVGARVDLTITGAQTTGYGVDTLIRIENLAGGSDADWFKGGTGANVLTGNGGNDTLIGGEGNDTLEGGSGTNTAVFAGTTAQGQITRNSDGSVTVTGPDGTDLLRDVRLLQFTDTTIALTNAAPTGLSLSANQVAENALPGSAIVATLSAMDADGDALSYSLAAGSPFRLDGNSLVLTGALDFETRASHSLTLTAKDAYGGQVSQTVTINVQDTVETTPFTMRGTAGADGLEGEAGNDLLYGLAGNDVLKGEAGNDRLYGFVGKDILTGGLGQDIFVFDAQPSKTTNIDKITDFSVTDDTIHLARSVFKKLDKKGVLKSAEFYAGTRAQDASDNLIYNKKTGALYYDADGTGSSAQIQIATLAKNLKMSHKDFFVI